MRLLLVSLAVGFVVIVVAGCGDTRRPIEGSTGFGGRGTGGALGPGGPGDGGSASAAAGAGGDGGGVVAGTGGVVGSGGIAGPGEGGGGATGGGGSGEGGGAAGASGGEGGAAAGASGGGGGEAGGAAGSSAGASGTGGAPAQCLGTCADGLVCERTTPATCADPQWAAWPMPNGKIDVAAGAPNEMSFTDNGDGTVTDNVTHLMWQQAVRAETFEWTVAGAYCRDLTLAGHDDWRLPSQIELISIADLGRANPAIDTTVFPDTPLDYFWSSSLFGTSPTTAASVTFARGNTRQEMMGTSLHVRCVR